MPREVILATKDVSLTIFSIIYDYVIIEPPKYENSYANNINARLKAAQ